MMVNWLKRSTLIAAAAILFTGCVSDDDLSVSDITVEALEAKMAAKTDPSGTYRKSKSFAFRQVVKVPQFLDDPIETLMETKVVLPDKFRITTIKDNEPVHIICSNGSKGWLADASSKRLNVLDGEKLQQLLTLSKLSRPAGGYRSIFPKVEIFICENDEGMFYLLKCESKKGNKFKIYVDADDFLLRRMVGDMKISGVRVRYDSRIKAYTRVNDIMIPRVTETVQDGQKQIVELLKYEIEPEIDERDFMPPVF